MKINLISFYYRLDEYPVKYSLGTARLAQSLYMKDEIEAKLVTCNLDDEVDDLYNDLSKLDGILAFSTYIWTRGKIVEIVDKLLDAKIKQPIILGGPEITMNSDIYLKYASIDNIYFIEGEGEYPILECLEAIKDSDNPNECADKKRFYINMRHEDVMNYPVSIFSEEFLRYQGMSDEDLKAFIWYETSRGCRYNCGYCGHKTRDGVGCFNEEAITEEIKNIGRLGTEQVYVVDPIIGGTPKAGKEVLSKFNQYAPNSRLIFYLRPEFIDDELIEILKESNVEEARIGIQTTNSDIPGWIRNNNIKKIKEVLPKLQEAKIKWLAELIVGLPGDNYEGLVETFDFVENVLKPSRVLAYHLTIIKETRLYREYLKKGDEYIVFDKETGSIKESFSYNEDELKKMLYYAQKKCMKYNRKGKKLYL